MKPAVLFSGRFADHSMGPGHPESPERVLALNRMLEEAPPGRFVPLEPRPATDDELARVHERGYIDFLRSTTGREAVVLDGDTSTGPKTFETALLAAGGVIRLVDLILDGRAANGFALVRPPGHHAEASQAMGFCFFNNVAIAAEHLIKARGLRRVLIVDWDLHHGNGTQHAFYSRPDVLYFSTHQVPLYPGTGRVSELGEGPGLGRNLNVPLAAGKGDGDYHFIFRRLLSPVAAAFKPEFILVNAGFDIAAGDPLGGMLVSREGFGLLADDLLDMAAASCPGRLAFVLEGGYSIEALTGGVGEILDRLGRPDRRPASEPDASGTTRRELEPCFRAFAAHWPL